MNALDVLSAMVDEGQDTEKVAADTQVGHPIPPTVKDAPAGKAGGRGAKLLELLKNKKMALGAGAGMLGLAALGAKGMKGAKGKKAAEALAKLKASKMKKRVAAGAAIGGGAGLAALLSKKASAKVRLSQAFAKTAMAKHLAGLTKAEQREVLEAAMAKWLGKGRKIKKVPAASAPEGQKMTVRGGGVHSASRQGGKGGAVSGLKDLGSHLKRTNR